MTGIPRYRDFDGPAVFRQGFRPFFLGAGVYAALAGALWLPIWLGDLPTTTAFGPLAWHVHEMLFGFVVATIAGFLLTAIPNWTGRMPLQGVPLIGLFGLWLIGRIAMLPFLALPPGVAGAADLAFLLALVLAIAREIVAGKNWRNLPMVGAVAVLLVANGLMHAEAASLLPADGYGQRTGIAVIVTLISLVGGRIVPSFTRNWLAKRGPGPVPAPFGLPDRIAMIVLIAALLGWIAVPGATATGYALVAAGLLALFRLSRWQGWRTFAEPLVWSLHTGYLWVPVGLILTGLAGITPDVPLAAGLHALTIGAMGSMTLAVMTRATLGHTGRDLAADGATTAIYVLIALAAITRIVAAFPGVDQLPLLWLTVFFWVAAFGLFALRYGRLALGR